MIVPYAHVGDLDAVAPATLAEMMTVAQRCIRVLRATLRPAGFNLGMNLGRPAGAGVADHLHLHVVPRWNGDTNYMSVVADTRVLSQSLQQQLRGAASGLRGDLVSDVPHQESYHDLSTLSAHSALSPEPALLPRLRSVSWPPAALRGRMPSATGAHGRSSSRPTPRSGPAATPGRLVLLGGGVALAAIALLVVVVTIITAVVVALGALLPVIVVIAALSMAARPRRRRRTAIVTARAVPWCGSDKQADETDCRAVRRQL